MPACSFNRGKYSTPEQVLAPSRPKSNGILVIAPKEMPPPIPRADEAPYEFFAADDPCPPEDAGNEAHCEVRIRRQGHDYTKNLKRKPKPKMALKAREALARKLRIHRARLDDDIAPFAIVSLREGSLVAAPVVTCDVCTQTLPNGSWWPLHEVNIY